MEDRSYEDEYCLDLDSGEVVVVSEYVDDENDETEALDRIEAKFDRYEPIPRVESHEAYRDMVDFIAALEDEHLAGLLRTALDGKRAFRRFMDVMLDYPHEEERWLRFKDDRMQQRALEWLEDIGVTLSEE